MPIILASCQVAGAPYTAALAREMNTVVYAAEDNAVFEESIGVYDVYSRDKETGERSSFVAIGNGARPFGKAIRNIRYNSWTGKVTVTYDAEPEIGTRLPRAEKKTFCGEKGKCEDK